MKLSLPSELNDRKRLAETSPTMLRALDVNNLEESKTASAKKILDLQVDEIVLDGQLRALQIQKDENKAFYDKKRKLLDMEEADKNSEYEKTKVEFEDKQLKIRFQIEQEKNDFNTFSILYQTKVEQHAKAEADALVILPVPNPEFRALFKSLPKDLSDVEPEDVARHMELAIIDDLASLTVSTKCLFLRALHFNKYHLIPEVQDMWIDKSPEWKALMGQEPCALVRRASNDKINMRIATLLKLQME